jgi:hypothetical protein
MKTSVAVLSYLPLPKNQTTLRNCISRTLKICSRHTQWTCNIQCPTCCNCKTVLMEELCVKTTDGDAIWHKLTVNCQWGIPLLCTLILKQLSETKLLQIMHVCMYILVYTLGVCIWNPGCLSTTGPFIGTCCCRRISISWPDAGERSFPLFHY